MDITAREVGLIFAALAVSSTVGYFLGRRFSPTWIGLVLALFWPLLLLFACPPSSRAIVFGAMLLSVIPAFAGFAAGLAKRPLKPGQ